MAVYIHYLQKGCDVNAEGKMLLDHRAIDYVLGNNIDTNAEK